VADRLSIVGELPASADAPGAADPGDADGSPASAPRERYELERLRAEATRTEATRRELLETVDLGTRRINQLVGERDQLERQLIRAERALQVLNRELGALTSRIEAPPAARRRPLCSTVRRLLLDGLARLRSRPQRPAPGMRALAPGGPPPARDRAEPLIPFAQGRAARPVICFVAFGLEGNERTSVLDVALRFGADHRVVPLVLTDDDDFAPLRSRGMAFEYFPPRSVREAWAPTLEWDLYLQRRLALIRRKWQPTRIIAFGKPAMLVVRLWSESPFEDPSLGALPAPGDPPAHRSPQPR
jgi:hypothetical protein